MKSIPLLNFPRAYCTIPFIISAISAIHRLKIFENYFPKPIHHQKHATISCSLVYKFFAPIPVIDLMLLTIKRLYHANANKSLSKFRYDTKAVSLETRAGWITDAAPGHRLLIDKRIQA